MNGELVLKILYQQNILHFIRVDSEWLNFSGYLFAMQKLPGNQGNVFKLPSKRMCASYDGVKIKNRRCNSESCSCHAEINCVGMRATVESINSRCTVP